MSKPKFHVYSVIERKDEKPYWHKIGAAWPTKSGDGIRIDLNSLPLSGNLMLMPPKEEEAVEAPAPQSLIPPERASGGTKRSRNGSRV
jgi:hypothetical protein